MRVRFVKKIGSFDLKGIFSPKMWTAVRGWCRLGWYDLSLGNQEPMGSCGNLIYATINHHILICRSKKNFWHENVCCGFDITCQLIIKRLIPRTQERDKVNLNWSLFLQQILIIVLNLSENTGSLVRSLDTLGLKHLFHLVQMSSALVHVRFHLLISRLFLFSCRLKD